MPDAARVPAGETPAVAGGGGEGEERCRCRPRRKHLQYKESGKGGEAGAVQQRAVFRGEGITDAAFGEKRRHPPPDGEDDGEDDEHAEIEAKTDAVTPAEQPGDKQHLTDGEQRHFRDQPHLPPLLHRNYRFGDAIKAAEGKEQIATGGNNIPARCEGKQQPRREPRQPVAKKRPAVRHRHAGPVLHCGEQKTGDDCGSVAINHLVAVPPLRDQPADGGMMTLIHRQPRQHGQHGESGRGEKKEAKTQIENRGIAGHEQTPEKTAARIAPAARATDDGNQPLAAARKIKPQPSPKKPRRI